MSRVGYVGTMTLARKNMMIILESSVQSNKPQVRVLVPGTTVLVTGPSILHTNWEVRVLEYKYLVDNTGTGTIDYIV